MATDMAADDNRLFRFDSKTPQRLVGAGALLVAAYTLFAILWPLRWSLVSTWAVIEVIFYVFYWRPRYSELNQQPKKHEPKVVDGNKTFQRFLKFCNDLPHGVDYQGYFSGWFKGAPFKDIKRENAEAFMAYGFWYRSRQQMKDMGLGHFPGQMVNQLEATWNVKFEPGYNSKLEFMGHLWEPLNASWRPLFFYLMTELVGMCARQLLKRWGFDHHKHNGLSYFTLGVSLPRAKTLTHSRAASSTALSDMSAATAATQWPATATLPSVGPKTPAARKPVVNGMMSDSSKAQQSADGMCNSGLASRSNSCTAPASSFSKPVGRTDSTLSRSKSSPFEAGPPDWTPFADPNSAAATARAVADAAYAPDSLEPGTATQVAGAGVVSAPVASPVFSTVSNISNTSVTPVSTPPLISGLSTHTSVMLRGQANPLQGALSEGLGSADIPVLFLHGVGGLPGYLEMILNVMGLGHPVIVVEFRGVAMRLGKVFTADEVADTIVGILDKLNVKEACVVGHSYGTFIAGMLARNHRKRVHTLCLIDPVCFGMFMPHLLHNFLYRKPVLKGWSLHHLVEYLKDSGRLVASRDMHVCATFARQFYWSDLNLWPEDLAPGSVVLLSGKDDLMDAAEVKDMLDVAGHVKVMYNHELTHGAFLLDREVKQAIMAEMRGLLARSGSAVVGLARPVLARTLTLMNHGFSMGGTKVRMRQGGGNGRYYVEDHGNHLVRTFTGNLTKMLSAGAGFRGSGGGRAMHGSLPAHRDGKAATDGGAAPLQGPGLSGTGVLPSGFDWTANKLMQTFSGPVRRRFGSKGWGSGRDRSSSDGGAEEAINGPSGGGSSRMNGPRSGQMSKRDAASMQRAVERIDEGEPAEESHE